jgi:methylmalonyl-CoA/ethylmalonyl-CoA epimerase
MSDLTLDHVVIAVHDLGAATADYEALFGRTPSWRGEHPKYGTRNTLFRVDNTYVELLEPVVPDTGVARYLERKGEGLHHVCFEVDDVEADLASLKQSGTEMIDQQTRIGLAGRICFLHPSAMDGALVELCQPLDDDAPGGAS